MNDENDPTLDAVARLFGLPRELLSSTDRRRRQRAEEEREFFEQYARGETVWNEVENGAKPNTAYTKREQGSAVMDIQVMNRRTGLREPLLEEVLQPMGYQAFLLGWMIEAWMLRRILYGE